jgi:hypothetical protein
VTDWTARFIAADDHADGAPLLRTEIDLDTCPYCVQSAVLLLSALGALEKRA